MAAVVVEDHVDHLAGRARALEHGSFHSVVDLQAAIHRYVAEHNADPKPFTRARTPGQILAKLNPPNAPVH